MDWYDVILYVLAFASAIFLYGLRLPQRWSVRKFPGPTRKWLLGNAFQALGGLNSIHSYQKWAQQLGPKPYALVLAADTAVVFPSSEDARSALIHAPARPDMTKNSFMPRKPNQDPKESLLWAREEKWRSLRAAWQPVFYSGSLKGYMEIMDTAAKLLVLEMKQRCESREQYFDMVPMIQEMTMNVIGQSAFGIDLHVQKADKAEQTAGDKQRSERLLKAARDFLNPISASPLSLASRLFPFVIPLLRIIVQICPDKTAAVFVKSRQTLRGIVDELLNDHQAALEASLEINGKPVNGSQINGRSASSSMQLDTTSNGFANGSSESTPETLEKFVPEIRKGVKAGSFIDLLVRAEMKDTGEKFTANQKAQQVILMLMAGYETSANALSFTTYLLSQTCNADKQAKLVEEIDARGEGYIPSYADLEEGMPYLEAVIKEALRLYPPGHIILREALDNLKIGGTDIDKGQWIFISSYSLHHDKRLWGDDVEEFRPERWLTNDPQQLKRVKKNFFAFGDGARVCPGQRFALLEIKITLIKILQQFRLQLAPHQEPLALRATITLGPKNGVFVAAEPR